MAANTIALEFYFLFNFSEGMRNGDGEKERKKSSGNFGRQFIVSGNERRKVFHLRMSGRTSPVTLK